MTGGMMPLKAEQAREIVLEKYTQAVQIGCEGDQSTCVILNEARVGRSRYLSGYCKTFAAAWISAARRIEKGKTK